ncbi:ATP-binding cassette domain-containing protein [Facklamia miroungae]|uniref:ABC-2 type transport system ATP-binding protein n=1 Tax=Facklamia miroungae TaxID=120956 RepID=A0A1G7NVC7_9LACT|nr:ATP-binding cassette domain-containing protein [Facklamia miroungae]NKZ28477.1 ATP-binding cassette domain-containing protein [Facklamia miroungae]SDF77931.1 ABC-2 type transport system ATP-binding protein [Facklamia miroungae]
MLSLQNVSISTRISVLENVSYNFLNGFIYGIVAPNGAGKTTLFRCISGLKIVDKGEISFNNQAVNNQRKNFFYLEDIEWLDQNLTGMDYLKIVKFKWKSSLKIEEIIKTCRLDNFVNVPIRKYSKGMKQRLIFALYLMSDAECYLMDEILNESAISITEEFNVDNNIQLQL